MISNALNFPYESVYESYTNLTNPMPIPIETSRILEISIRIYECLYEVFECFWMFFECRDVVVKMEHPMTVNIIAMLNL